VNSSKEGSSKKTPISLYSPPAGFYRSRLKVVPVPGKRYLEVAGVNAPLKKGEISLKYPQWYLPSKCRGTSYQG